MINDPETYELLKKIAAGMVAARSPNRVMAMINEMLPKDEMIATRMLIHYPTVTAIRSTPRAAASPI